MAGNSTGLLEEEAVAHPERGGVDEAHHVAGEGFVDDLAFPAEDLLGIFGGEGLAGPALGHHHAAFEDAGTDPDEGDVVAVCLVHAGLDLEDEPGEGRLDGPRGALDVGPRGGRRGEVHEGVEDLLHAEVQGGGAEEDRRGLAGVEGVDVELEVGLDDQSGFIDGVGPVVALAGRGLLRGEVLGDYVPSIGLGSVAVSRSISHPRTRPSRPVAFSRSRWRSVVSCFRTARRTETQGGASRGAGVPSRREPRPS